MINIRNQVILFSVLIVIFLIVSRYLSLSESFAHWWTDMAWTIFCGLATYACFNAYRHCTGQRKIAWLYFTAANLSWFIGIVIWDYLELIEKIVTPFPAYSDVGFTLMAPLYIIGIVYYRRDTVQATNTLLQISKLGILITCLCIIHIVIFADPIRKLDESILYILNALAYAVLYIACFIYALLSLWQLKSNKNREVFLLVVLSIFTHTVADSSYAYILLGKSYVVGNYIDVLWLIAFGFIYFAARKEVENKYIPETSDNAKYDSLNRKIDSFITPVAIFSVIISVSLFYSDIQDDIVVPLLVIVILLSVFISMREWASAAFEKKLNISINESENNLRDLTSNIPGITYQFLISTSGESSFPYVGPNVLSFFGISSREIEKNAELWINKIHPDDVENFNKTVLTSYQEMQPWYWEGRFENKDSQGSYVWFRGNSVPRKLDDGSVLWNGIMTDITKYREEQALLSKDKVALENIVVERTQELVLAKNKAERASEAKTVFLSHMGHELRTPLNAILGFSQLLEMDELTDDQYKSVDEIISAGNILLFLVSDLLDLASIESGNSKFDIDFIPAHKVVESSVNLVSVLARESQISIEINDENFHNIICVDERKISQVIINLLTNGIKYNKPGGHIKIFSEIVGDNRLKILIEDDGIGIPEDKCSQAFEKFNRLGNEGSNIQGSGIGLSLCKQIVELMDGEIGFFSNPQGGTTFWVTCKIQSPEKGKAE